MLTADGGGCTLVGEESPLMAVKLENGSLTSPDGDVKGVGRPEENILVVLFRRRPDAERLVRDDVGDAKRDRVLRKVDFRFGGGGNDAMSMGRGGKLAPGWTSRSFWSSSTISMAVRVRVRL